MSQPTAEDLPVPEVYGWVTLRELTRGWADGELLEDDELIELAMTAWEQCQRIAIMHLPGEVEPPAIPYRLKQAQRLQARAVYRARLVGTADAMGPDGYTVTVYPMDWTVKGMLRPKQLRMIT